MIINPNVPRGLSIHDSQEPTYARPDFSQMIPFKPKAKYIPGEHPVKGAVFAFLFDWFSGVGNCIAVSIRSGTDYELSVIYLFFGVINHCFAFFAS